MKPKLNLKKSKLPFLRYCRFVISDTLDMAGAPDYVQLNHEYYMELWRSNYIQKKYK